MTMTRSFHESLSAALDDIPDVEMMHTSLMQHVRGGTTPTEESLREDIRSLQHHYSTVRRIDEEMVQNRRKITDVNAIVDYAAQWIGERNYTPVTEEWLTQWEGLSDEGRMSR